MEDFLKKEKEKAENFLKNNKSYCSYPFKEIYGDSNGRYRLCCHAYPSPTLEHMNFHNTTPFDYFRSPEMETIRNKMFVGEKLPECQACYDLEDKGFKSHRSQKYPETGESDSDLKNIGLKLRLTGSYCNLSCYMCFPYNSSTRRNELNKIYGNYKKSNEDFTREFKNIKYSQFEKCMDDIINNIQYVGYMQLTGGEPIQLPKIWDLLNRIPDENAKNIRLYYDTNLTKLKWKKHTIFEVAERFKDVTLGVSCDHYGEKLKWMRYPIDVEEFERNLVEAKDLIYQLNCTVSYLNLFDLEEMYDYYLDKFGIRMTFHNVARGPKFLSPRNLPKDVKDELKEKYSKSRIITTNPREQKKLGLNPLLYELSQPPWSEDMIPKAKKYCDDLSKHRNFNWRELWNEY